MHAYEEKKKKGHRSAGEAKAPRGGGSFISSLLKRFLRAGAIRKGNAENWLSRQPPCGRHGNAIVLRASRPVARLDTSIWFSAGCSECLPLHICFRAIGWEAHFHPSSPITHAPRRSPRQASWCAPREARNAKPVRDERCRVLKCA